MVVVGPEHAQHLHREGWSRQDVRSYLFEHARRPVRELMRGGTFSAEFRRAYWPPWIDGDDPDQPVPVVKSAADLLLVVAGGSMGKFSMVIPGWGDFGTRAVTKPVSSR